MKILEKILDFLKEHLPGLALAFRIGYSLKKDDNEKLRKELLESEKKREMLSNEIKVNDNKSSIDHVNDIIGRK